MAEELFKELEAVSLKFAEFTRNEEYDKIVDLYTEDAIIIPPGELVKGRKAIVQYARNELPKFTGLFYETNLYFELLNETTAMTTDLFGRKDSTGKIIELIRSNVLYKKIDGKWLMNRDIFNNTPTPKSELQKTLDARVSKLFEAYDKEDYDSAAACFTDDATLMADGRETGIGREAIKTILKQLIPERKTLVCDELFYSELLNDTTAYSNGVVKSVGTDGKVQSDDRNSVIWRKIDGEWYIFFALFNIRPVSTK